jgi:hypothetical protein
MTKQLTEGQRSYEEKRAAKAGVSLDKWLSMKDREKREAARAREEAVKPPPPAKKPGLISRLIDLAHKPL